jgi:hypothetical protein
MAMSWRWRFSFGLKLDPGEASQLLKIYFPKIIEVLAM